MSAGQPVRPWYACTGDPCTCPKPIEAWREKNATPILRVIGAVMEERRRQDAKWGEQNHPDLAPSLEDKLPDDYEAPALMAAAYYGLPTASDAQQLTETDAARGDASWLAIAVEELAEACDAAAFGDPAELRTEVVQLAAVCVQWVQAIDRRTR